MAQRSTRPPASFGLPPIAAAAADVQLQNPELEDAGKASKGSQKGSSISKTLLVWSSSSTILLTSWNDGYL